MIHKEIDFNIRITNSSVLMPLSRYRNNGINPEEIVIPKKDRHSFDFSL